MKASSPDLHGADEANDSQPSSGSRFPINKDDAITIGIALAVSFLIRTYVPAAALSTLFALLS